MGIYLRKNSWYFDFLYGGERYVGSIGPVSRTLAKEELSRRKAAAIEGRLNPSRGRRSPLFKDFSEEFLKQKQSTSRPTSASRIEQALKPLKERFDLKRLNDISAFEIEKYRRDRKTARKADATINRELQALRHLFNTAIAWKKAQSNPMKAVKLRREENTRIRFLTEDEEEKLSNACGESLWNIVVVALNTGFRRGELLSLTWLDVDFDRELITVQAAYAKNGERRSIPMNNSTRLVLEKLKAKAGVAPHVFLSSKGEAYRLVSTVFKKAVRRAGIVNFRFHDLRHTFASRLVMAGIDLRTVQTLLGHKTINMTLRYTHLAPEHLKRAIEVLDQGKKSHQFSQHPQLVGNAKRG